MNEQVGRIVRPTTGNLDDILDIPHWDIVLTGVCPALIQLNLYIEAIVVCEK